MKKTKHLFLWMILLNKRILKQPLFLVLIAMVPLLVFGVGRLSQESSSLITAAVAPQNAEDEASALLIQSLVEGSNSAVRYISCADKDALCSVGRRKRIRGNEGTCDHILCSHQRCRIKDYP